MGLEIRYLNQEAPQPKVVVNQRLWSTADGRLVGDGHPDAARLFCAPGREVPQAELEALVLDESLGKVVAGPAAAAEEPVAEEPVAEEPVAGPAVEEEGPVAEGEPADEKPAKAAKKGK